MDAFQAARIDSAGRNALAARVNDDFKKSGISRSALAESICIPRETLRRKMAGGDFTVTELLRLAPVIGGDFDEYTDLVRKAVAKVAA